MIPQTTPRKPRNSSKVNLLISFVVHSALIGVLVYFAAREGFLGKQLKKIAVELVKEPPPEKPKETEKPKEEPPPPPKIEPPKVVEAPKTEAPKPAAGSTPPPAVIAPPAVAPPAADVPSFAFDGGKSVQSTSDPVQLYRGFVEYTLRSKWNRPTDMADDHFVAEVEVSVDRDGQISNPQWKKGSGDSRWDASVREALATTKRLDRPPPKNFPPHVLVRFDVQEYKEPVIQ